MHVFTGKLKFRTTADMLNLNLTQAPNGGEEYHEKDSNEPGTPLTGSLQKDNNESENNISSCSTLDIVNKVDNVSFNALENQIRELSQSRNEYKRKLEEITEEKERYSRQLEVISAAHESRITEMHCVIAELTKKLRTKQENTIVEENELEGSEISYQEGSIYNSELNLSNPEVECQTDGDCSVGVCDREAGYDCLEIDEGQKIFNDTAAKTQVEALQEEVLHLRAQIALLQSQIANPLGNRNANDEENEAIEVYDMDVEADAKNQKIINQPKIATGRVNNQGDKKICYNFKGENDSNLSDTNERTTHFPNQSTRKQMYLSSSAINNECNKKYLVVSNKMLLTSGEHNSSLNNCSLMSSPQDAPPIPKMAERVKLRRTMENTECVTASDLAHSGINNSGIVEHLVSNLTQGSSTVDDLVETSPLNMEFQRLQRRIEHLKMRNTVLSLTLQESKEHCDHLYLLCGKYESNAIALQLALNCSDRAIEAYDVMLALLESKLAILKERSESAEDSRKAVESVARHLLDRLESEKDMSENSLGPWQNTFCISDKPFEPWTPEDDNRLRNHVSKLKGRRSTVQNTIVTLESPFSAFYEKSRIALESNKEIKEEKNIQMDLEMAVLMQELLNLRDENIQLKQKRDEVERDRQLDKIGILQDALQQLQTQISTDSDVLFNLSTQDRSFSEADHAALTERQLVEALTRESALKSRIKSLIVSASKKSSDEKYEAVQNNMKELQKSNINLSQLLEQTKRKYQSRIRKLEMNIEVSQQKHRGSILSQDNVPETTL